MGRKRFGREAWDRLCEHVRPDQHPEGFDVGLWSAKKLFHLAMYLEQVTRGMHGHRSFPAGLTYVDLFAGSGLTRTTDESGRFRNYPGSPVLAAGINPAKPFERLLLVEKSHSDLLRCEQRVREAGHAGTLRAWNADCNDVIDEVADAIPSGSLTVAFVDPYSLDIEFETIRRLAAQRPLDLLILFADAFDIVRNVDEVYYPRKSDKLDKLLGEDSHWRQEWNTIVNRDGGTTRQIFANIYLRQLKSLGYNFAETWPIAGPSGPLYRLVFASKHPLGLKYCEIALGEDFGGELGLFGRG